LVKKWQEISFNYQQNFWVVILGVKVISLEISNYSARLGWLVLWKLECNLLRVLRRWWAYGLVSMNEIIHLHKNRFFI
jgi:hypothetical protein